MKFGDVVIYKEFGTEFPALVLSTRELEHHSGENGEPLINLAFVKQVKNGAGDVVNVSGSSREAEQIQFRHDIAHESHEFSADAKEELTRLGLLPPGGSIPGGRYVEASVLKSEIVASVPASGSDPVVASPEGEAVADESGPIDPQASEAAPAQQTETKADGEEAEEPTKETVQ